MKTDTHGAGGGGGGAAVTRRPLHTGINGYSFHPLTLAFPLLNAEQLGELAEEIGRRGASGPVLKRGEIILDDPNRCRACELAGVAITFREWDGSGSLAEVVTRAILPRTHLSESQRAAIAVPISDHLAGETVPSGLINGRANLRNSGRLLGSLLTSGKSAKPSFLENGSVAAQLQRPRISESCSNDVRVDAASKDGRDTPLGRAAEIAAKMVGVSPRYVYQARKLRDSDRDLFEQVKQGQMTLSAAQVAMSKQNRAKATDGLLITHNRVAGDDRIIVGDCMKEMARMGDASFDLIFADPPYNLGWQYDADPSHDLLPEPRYLEFTEKWIGHCARLLTPNGSIFVMINARWQGRFDVLLRNAGAGGLHHRSTIVWHDTFPNHTDANFQPAARFIHYFTRSPKKFTFNADPVRVPSRRDEIGDARRVHDKGIVPHDVWDVPRVAGNSAERVPFEDAPPQVPAQILERIILAASNSGDRVFDPFTGNGTTWKAARKLGRKFTGVERSAKYAEQARQWACS